MPLAGSDDWGDKLRRLRHLQINQRPKPIAFPEPNVRALARLLRKIYEVDPLTCPRCLAPMKVVAVIEQPKIIRQILQHLNLYESSQRAPPPRLFAHKLDQLLASLSPEQARQIQLSTDSIFWDDVATWADS